MTQRFPGPTWTSTHVYGDGLKNAKRNLCYWNIPKCASMWMRRYIAEVGHAHIDDKWIKYSFVNDDMTGHRSIIVLRDPVERWISTCPATEKMPNIIKNDRDIDGVFDNLDDWQKDEHLAPQFDFINGLDLSHAVFFLCGPDLSHNIAHFFKSHDFANFKTPDPTNVQSRDLETQTAAAIWHELLNTTKNLQKFKEAYQKDYDLIQSVEFYNDT